VSIRAEIAFLDRHNSEINRMVAELPIKSPALQLYFSGAEIEASKISAVAVKSIRTDMDSLVLESLDLENTDINELNYLAAKLSRVDGDDLEKFNAIMESEKHQNSGADGNKLANMINIIENLDSFEFLNCYDEQAYGEYLLSGYGSIVDKIKRHLESSASSEGDEYANVVEYLSECADDKAFGRAMAQEKDGEFINDGFLIAEENFRYVYNGLADIPDEYRVFDFPSVKSLLKVENTDLSALLLKMHAVCGENYMRDAKYNIGTLATGGDDFFILDNGGMLVVSPAELLYRKDTFEHKHWSSLDDSADFKAYFVSVTGRNNGQIIGNICEAEIKPMQESISNLGISFTHVDAKLKDGNVHTFNRAEWDAMYTTDRAKLKSWVEKYDTVDKGQIFSLVGIMHHSFGNSHEPISADAFLININEPYMEAAFNNKLGFIRLSPDAARELLAQGATDIHRLTSDDTEKLLPIDAVKIGMRQASDREFGVSGMDGLEKWAKRTATDMVRQAERGERAKIRDEESL